MKSRSRREIIDENKSLKKELAYAKERAQGARDQLDHVQHELNNANDRLRRIGAYGGYEYTKGADSGTLMDYVTFDPCHIELSGKVPNEGMEFIKTHLTERLANALLENGLVLVNYERDPMGYMVAIARIDVIPWDMITRKNEMLMLNHFEPTGGW